MDDSGNLAFVLPHI